MTYLNLMTPGQTGKVIGVIVDSPMGRRLAELGLIPGREITYLRDAPLKDPLQIQIGPSRLSLRHCEASIVAVEVKE